MIINKKDYPLVSIVIITYNSSKYVLETLESAKVQTHQNIELIVSDDCSKDNTAEICTHWIAKNKDRFVRTEFITVVKNTGIPANCNRGLKAASGEWIKFIAGDDTLISDCIENFVIYIRKSSDEKISFIHSSINYYKNEIKNDTLLGVSDKSKSFFNSPNIKANHQYKLLLLHNGHIAAASTIYRKTILDEVGGFDEEMPFEDWPIYIKLTGLGYKLFYLQKKTINYRFHNQSYYNNLYKDKYIYNPFYKNDRIVFNKYIRDKLTFIERIIEVFEYNRKYIFDQLGFNKRNWLNNIINYPFLLFFRLYKSFSQFLVKYRIRKTLQ